MKIYISGPMTGIHNFNASAFNAAEKKLRAEGHFPVSPVALDALQGDTYAEQQVSGKWEHPKRKEYLRRDIQLLADPKECIEGIYMLQGWEKSKGAKLELEVARALGLAEIYELKSSDRWPHERTTAREFLEQSDVCGVPMLEPKDLLERFHSELAKPTGDGNAKRRSGSKPPWYKDNSHEAAIYSHLAKWKKGEKKDADSGAHPLVHAAWRCLAIACQETGNVPSEAQ